MCGTTDFNREYHPYCIMITKNEETEDCAFLFKTLKDCVEKIHQTDFNPTILLADTAAAIKNGFQGLFQLLKRFFCWAHVKRAVDGK